MRPAIFIYKRGTRLARIARQLGIPVVYPGENVSFRGKKRPALLRFNVNWGCLGKNLPQGCLNSNAINAARKVRAFERFDKEGVPCPEWSREYSDLNKKLKAERTIFARKDGLSGGAGICIITPEDRANGTDKRKAVQHQADFYSARVSHQREFRLHVWAGKVIVEQVKFIEKGSTSPIHNYENGAKFSTQSYRDFLSEAQIEELRALAIKAVAVLDLYFGAVDVILNQKGKFYVLEVNTAPGIRSDPVERAYKSALKDLIIENAKKA